MWEDVGSYDEILGAWENEDGDHVYVVDQSEYDSVEADEQYAVQFETNMHPLATTVPNGRFDDQDDAFGYAMDVVMDGDIEGYGEDVDELLH